MDKKTKRIHIQEVVNGRRKLEWTEGAEARDVLSGTESLREQIQVMGSIYLFGDKDIGWHRRA